MSDLIDEMWSQAGGEYKIDVLVKIEVFGGANVVYLVECKHKHRPVEREDMMVLEAKLRVVWRPAYRKSGFEARTESSCFMRS